MWRDGSGSESMDDLREFYTEECTTSSVLIVDDVSYRAPQIKRGDISHVDICGKLELSLREGNLFGVFTLDPTNDPDEVPNAQRMALIEGVKRQPEVRLDTIQNYQRDRSVSLYSGDPCSGDSWSFHCVLPAKPK